MLHKFSGKSRIIGALLMFFGLLLLVSVVVVFVVLGDDPSSPNGTTKSNAPASDLPKVDSGNALGSSPNAEREIAISDTSLSDAITNEADKKIVKTGNYTFQVEQVEKSIGQIENLVKAHDAIILSSSVYSPSADKDEKVGIITIRVPVEEFDAFRAHAKELAKKIDNEEIQSTDVTEEYIDLKARLATMKAEEQALVEILKQAKTIEDTLKVRSELTRVRSDIESMEGRIKYLDSQTNYSSVTIFLTEEGVLKAEEFSPANAFQNAIRSLGNALKQTALTFIAIAVYAIGLLLPLGIVLWIVVKLFHRNRKPQPKNNPTNKNSR